MLYSSRGETRQANSILSWFAAVSSLLMVVSGNAGEPTQSRLISVDVRNGGVHFCVYPSAIGRKFTSYLNGSGGGLYEFRRRVTLPL